MWNSLSSSLLLAKLGFLMSSVSVVYSFHRWCPVRLAAPRHGNLPKRLAALKAKVAEEGLILAEAQVIAMERKREKREAFGKIETGASSLSPSPGHPYVGNINGLGRIYQQSFIDTYSKVAFAKLYDPKNAITAADMLNDKVMPFTEEQEIPLLRILTDPGTEYCVKLSITNTNST